MNIGASAVAEACCRYDVRRLSLFGPAARGEITPERDVDFMGGV
jgi:predicted nucleotidyltransferase